MDLWFLWFYVQELPKAQPTVVLVLKHLRRQGKGLKAHQTDWEKPGIEPATRGLQDMGLSPTPRPLLNFRSFSLWPCSLAVSVLAGWVYGFVVLCLGTPEGSTGSGSGFKAPQKTWQRLNVSSNRLGETGNRTCNPWFTRHRFIPYTTAASFFLWLCSLAVPVLAGWFLCFLWFYVQELPKAQPTVDLVLTRLRRRGNGLKSYPTDWEKPGIQSATPGLQDRFIPYTTAASYYTTAASFCFVAVFLG